MNRLICLVIVGIAGSFGRAQAITDVSEFHGSFDGWAQQWHIESPTGSPGIVSLSNERGYGDSQSLKFDMGNGAGDDGTLWIEKTYSVPPGVPAPVHLSFALFSPRQSDVNNFQVKAYIGEQDPQFQGDFEWIGQTNRVAGWDEFALTRTVDSASGQIWVALGVRVAWETPRDYWIDHVQVTVVPEPGSGLTISLLLATVGLLRRQRKSFLC